MFAAPNLLKSSGRAECESGARSAGEFADVGPDLVRAFWE